MSKISLSDILQLSVPERIQLAEDIWDSVVESPEILELSDDQKKILDDRFELFRKNTQTALSWEDVKKQIRKR